MTLQSASLNVKGLATPSKFSFTANLLKKYKNINIITLQETNISPKKLLFTSKKWPLMSFWTPHVAILINNPRIKVENVFSTNKRTLILDCILNSIPYRIETIYVPPDRPRRLAFL